MYEPCAFYLSNLVTVNKLLSLDQSWNWLDGSKVTFVKWTKKIKSGRGQCSILLASNETWTKVECSRGYGRVVCKVPLGKYVTCPYGTFLKNGSGNKCTIQLCAKFCTLPWST